MTMANLKTKMTKEYNAKRRTSQIGGDKAYTECSECESDNTIYLEYWVPGEPENSSIGILCQDCEHEEDPDEYSHRFEEETL